MEAMPLDRSLGKPVNTEPRANHPKWGSICFNTESSSNKSQVIIIGKSCHFFSLSAMSFKGHEKWCFVQIMLSFNAIASLSSPFDNALY